MAGRLPRPGTAVIRANGWFSGQRPVKKPRQVHQLVGEVVPRTATSASGAARPRDLVGARGAPDAEVDPAGMERLQHAELLGHHQRHVGWAASRRPSRPAWSCRVGDVPISTGGAELAMPGMLWCSATQNRRYPSRSACRARSIVSRRACAAVPPSGTGAMVEHGQGHGPRAEGQGRIVHESCPNRAKLRILPPRKG